jgi:transposase
LHRDPAVVPKKTLEQQDVQALRRARQRLVNRRTALISQMRGLLHDRGIAIGVAASRARRLIPQILSEPNEALSDLMREIITSCMHSCSRSMSAFGHSTSGSMQSLKQAKSASE